MSVARLFRVRPRVRRSVRAAGTPALSAMIRRVMACRAGAPVGVAVGGDHALVDAPGRLDLNVVLIAEQGGQPLLLAVGEQVGAGVQGAAGGGERGGAGGAGGGWGAVRPAPG